MASTKKAKKTATIKKETPTDHAAELINILGVLKLELSEKKYHSRLKKALKILTHGLNKKKNAKAKVKKTKTAKSSTTPSVKKKAVKTKKAVKK